MARTIKFFILIFCIPFITRGAEILSFPQNKQLYSRDNSNIASVQISLKNNLKTLSHFSLIGIANGDTISNLSKKLNSNEFWDFSLPISAGLIKYSFYLYEKSDSLTTLVNKAEEVVCGDVFVIYGQSNGLAIFGVNDYDTSLDDKWIRNAVQFGSNGVEWHLGKKPSASVGVLGLWFAKQTVEGQKIPVAIINGCEGGQNIINLGLRNKVNPKDKSTFYGNLLSRVIDANSVKTIKGFIWYQGEGETSAGPQAMLDYGGKLDTLYTNIIADFPPINRFVLMQINLLKSGIGEAGIVRNYQANFRTDDPKVERLATVGQSFWYDGVHYSRQGYESIAIMIYKYFENNVYSISPNYNFRSPHLQKAVKDFGMNRLRLIFDEGQQVSLEEYLSRPYGRRDINPYIFINGKNYQIKKIENVDNEIRLEINDLELANKITYLPSDFSDTNSPGYDGPVIKNSEGFSALTFYDFDIGIYYDKKLLIEKKEAFRKSNRNKSFCKNCVLKTNWIPNEILTIKEEGTILK